MIGRTVFLLCTVFKVARVRKDAESGLGISLEGTVDVEEGVEVNSQSSKV